MLELTIAKSARTFNTELNFWCFYRVQSVFHTLEMCSCRIEHDSKLHSSISISHAVTQSDKNMNFRQTSIEHKKKTKYMNRTQFDLKKKKLNFCLCRIFIGCQIDVFSFFVEFNPEKFFNDKMNIYWACSKKKKSITVNCKFEISSSHFDANRNNVILCIFRLKSCVIELRRKTGLFSKINSHHPITTVVAAATACLLAKREWF